MKFSNAKGFTTISMLIFIMVMILLLIQGYYYRTVRLTRFIQQEKLYRQAYHQAASGIAWGLQQTWPAIIAGANWQCLSPQATIFVVCIKQIANTNAFLLRSQSQLLIQSVPMTLYQWIKEVPDNKLRFIALTSGWFDYCPYYNEALCE